MNTWYTPDITHGLIIILFNSSNSTSLSIRLNNSFSFNQKTYFEMLHQELGLELGIIILLTDTSVCDSHDCISRSTRVF